MKNHFKAINKDNLVVQVLFKNKFNILTLVCFSLIASFSELIFLKDMTPFVEDVLRGSTVDRLFVIRQLSLVTIWTFFGILFRLKLAKLMALIAKDLSFLIFINIGSLSLMRIENLGKSKITTLSSLYLDNVINGICHPLLRLVEIFLTIIVGIIVIFLSLGFGVLPVILLGIFGLIFLIYITKYKSYEYGHIDSNMANKSVLTLNFFIENIKEIILQKDPTSYSKRFSQILYNRYFANGKAMFLGDLPRKIIETLIYLFICLVGLFNFFKTYNFAETIPSLAVSLIVLQRITPLFQSAYRSCFSIINIMPVLEKYNFENSFKVFQKSSLNQSKNKDHRNTNIYTKKITAIEITNLSVGHRKKELYNVPKLTIVQGKPLVIVGKSGSGKTTLVETIIGLRPPISGSCNFYNKDKILKYYRNISYVPQTVQLTGETLFEMISFNNKNLINYRNNKKIEKYINYVLEICCIKNDFIQSFNDLHEPINENATSISGGQRQRIAIARALLRGNGIIVLDEATNGLDEKLEEIVISNIVNELRSKILICVTHSTGLTKYFKNVLSLTG